MNKEIKVGDEAWIDGYTSIAQNNFGKVVIEEVKDQFDKDTGEKFQVVRIDSAWFDTRDGSCYSNPSSMYYIEFMGDESSEVELDGLNEL